MILLYDWLGEDVKYGHLLKKLKNEDGSWSIRDDVWVYYPRNPNAVTKGNLTVGFGANSKKIGPELMFGHIVGDHFENQVLLIKAAWGGKSLAEVNTIDWGKIRRFFHYFRTVINECFDCDNSISKTIKLCL